MAYNLYLAESIGGGKQDHHAILVETSAEGDFGLEHRPTSTADTTEPTEAHSGHLFQVKGSIQNGQKYESRTTRWDDSALGKTILGTVAAENFHRIDEICRSIPAPKKQFDGPKRLYPGVPLYACQEWTKDALKALEANGVLCAVDGKSVRERYMARRAQK